MLRYQISAFRPLALLLALGMAIALAPRFAAAGGELSVQQVHDMASRGEILLIDIRSRTEWQQSGVAPQALTISMHEDAFYARLDEAVRGERDRPIAVICAAGGRSTMMRAQLALRGYSNLFDVPAGMTGGRHGPGWIASGLPVVPYRE